MPAYRDGAACPFMNFDEGERAGRKLSACIALARVIARGDARQSSLCHENCFSYASPESSWMSPHAMSLSLNHSFHASMAWWAFTRDIS